MVFTPDGSKAYVAVYHYQGQSEVSPNGVDYGSVCVLDCDSHRVIRQLNNVGFEPMWPAIDPSGRAVYVADQSDSIYIINTTTDEVEVCIFLGDGSRPNCIAFNTNSCNKNPIPKETDSAACIDNIKLQNGITSLCIGIHYPLVSGGTEELNTMSWADYASKRIADLGYISVVAYDSYRNGDEPYLILPIYPSNVIRFTYNHSEDIRVLFFAGHGNIESLSGGSGGGILFLRPDPPWREGWMVAQNGGSATLANANLSNVKLVVLLACSTGATNSNYGNLLTTSIDGGADCAIGFDRPLMSGPEELWSEYFWDNITDKKTVYVAAQDALKRTQNVYGDDAGGLSSMHIVGDSSIIL